MTPTWSARRAACVPLMVVCMACGGCAGLLTFSGEDGAGGQVHQRSSSGVVGHRAGTVVVHRGDTLYSIAFRNDLDYRQIARWNGIGSDYTIYPGQRLRLTAPPGSGRAVAPVKPKPAASKTTTPKPPARAPSPPVVVATSPSAPTIRTPKPTPPITHTGSTAGYASPSGSTVFNARHWQWPTQGKVSTKFGPPKEKGVDIGGRYGQNVVAAAPGKVVYSGNALKGYGELIIIKHSDDYLSAYGFNSRRLVREGEQVRAGQLIAQMGEGPGQKPELHFEIRYKGQPADPLKYLPKR